MAACPRGEAGSFTSGIDCARACPAVIRHRTAARIVSRTLLTPLRSADVDSGVADPCAGLPAGIPGHAVVRRRRNVREAYILCHLTTLASGEIADNSPWPVDAGSTRSATPRTT